MEKPVIVLYAPEGFTAREDIQQVARRIEVIARDSRTEVTSFLHGAINCIAKLKTGLPL